MSPTSPVVGHSTRPLRVQAARRWDIASWFWLALITVGAVLVHGYHPAVEDAAIYLPGIEKILHPDFFPHFAEFFSSHAGLTIYPQLIAASVHFSGLSLSVVLLGWHLLTILLLLWIALELSRCCFADSYAHWGSVALLAGLLTLPVAGTALYIMDEYVNPRSFSTVLVLLAVWMLVQRRYWLAGAVLVLTATLHPLMTVFGVAFAGCWWMAGRMARPASLSPSLPTSSSRVVVTFFMAVPLGMFPPVSGAYRTALEAHAYFFLARWEWYEWIGLVAPTVLFLWCERIARRRGSSTLQQLCRGTVIFGVLFFLAALLTLPASLERFLLVQPMRSLHLVYVLLTIVGGGLLGGSVLRGSGWRWAVLFLPLCGGMYYAQRQLFPATPHLELPGAAPDNSWVEAFVWIRQHTPLDATFALDPEHMSRPGEDQHGFRAIAERSMLADAIKDEGAVTMFPQMADDWQQQVQSQRGWRRFGLPDFQRLKLQYGVNWVVLERDHPVPDLECSFQNDKVRVCRLP